MLGYFYLFLFLSFLSLYTLHSVVSKVCHLWAFKTLSASYPNDHKTPMVSSLQNDP